jgi:BlaI family transcriptional regulator, penicillinase repressor
MKRKTHRQLTPLELQIMRVLWDLGPSSVQGVQKALDGEKLAYTTVQTMLNVLHRKERVRRELRGRAYIYVPVLSQETAARQSVIDVLDRVFGGSVEGLVMSLVKARKLDAKKIKKLSELVDAQLKQEDRGGDS